MVYHNSLVDRIMELAKDNAQLRAENKRMAKTISEAADKIRELGKIATKYHADADKLRVELENSIKNYCEIIRLMRAELDSWKDSSKDLHRINENLAAKLENLHSAQVTHYCANCESIAKENARLQARAEAATAALRDYISEYWTDIDKIDKEVEYAIASNMRRAPQEVKANE